MIFGVIGADDFTDEQQVIDSLKEITGLTKRPYLVFCQTTPNTVFDGSMKVVYDLGFNGEMVNRLSEVIGCCQHVIAFGSSPAVSEALIKARELNLKITIISI